jgi:hypothetical protein
MDSPFLWFPHLHHSKMFPIPVNRSGAELLTNPLIHTGPWGSAIYLASRYQRAVNKIGSHIEEPCPAIGGDCLAAPFDQCPGEVLFPPCYSPVSKLAVDEPVINKDIANQ